jgi:hypothetical protein
VACRKRSEREQTYSNTREKTGFGHAQENTRNQEAVVVLNQAHECHDETPCHHDGGQPATRSELLEKQVGGDFKGRICEEEDCETPVVFVWQDAKIGAEAFDLGVSNVSTWVASVTGPA